MVKGDSEIETKDLGLSESRKEENQCENKNDAFHGPDEKEQSGHRSPDQRYLYDEDGTLVVTEPTDICGEWGSWQKVIFVLVMLTNFPANWQNLGYTFFAFPLDHWCTPPADLVKSDNFSIESWKSLALPVIQILDKTTHSKCEMYEPSTDNVDLWMKAMASGNITFNHEHSRVLPCQSWEFDHSFFGETIVEKFSLVCDKGWLSSFSQSIYMFGFMIAVGVTGQLGDRFGRRPVMLFCIALMQLSATIIAFATNYIFYVVMRFFVAMGASGLFTASFVILMEISGPKHRTFLGVMMGFWWAMAYVALTGLAWVARSWFSLQLALTLPWYSLIIFWWFMPESPKWLLAQGRFDEARELLEKGADQNKQSVAHVYITANSFFKYMEKKQKEKPDVLSSRATVLDLFKTPTMRCKTLNIFFCWFVVAFIYYGLSLNSGDLGGDAYLNLALASAVEIPSMVLTYIVLTYLGRRRPLSASLLIGGITCLLTIPIGQDLLWLRIALAMAGKLFIASSFAVIYIVSAEIFPTVVRNVGVGSSSTCARIGSMLAPFVKELGKFAGMAVPLGFFGVLSVLSGLFILILPETHEKPVPDTIEQGEAIKRTSCWSNQRSVKNEDVEKAE